MSKASKQNAGRNRRVKVKSLEQPDAELTKMEQRRLRGGATDRETGDLVTSKPAGGGAKQTGSPAASGRQPMGF